MKHFYLALFFLAGYKAGGQTDFQYGLKFASYEVEKEKRTSLDITGAKPAELGSCFTLSFNVKIYQNKFTFGYIVRMLGENNHNIDILLNSRDGDLAPKLMFIYKMGEIKHEFILQDIGLKLEQWIDIQIGVDAKTGVLSIDVGGTEFKKNVSGLENMSKTNIAFGRIDSGVLQTTDIASMDIKNIVIRNCTGKRIYEWPLGTHTQDGSFDEVSRKFAKCENGIWIMDRHVFWKKRMEFTCAKHPRMSFDSGSDQIAIIDQNNLYIYDISGDSLRTYPVTLGSMQGKMANQFHINSNTGQLFSYDFKGQPSTFEPVNGSWSHPGIDTKDSEYFHHNKYFSGKLNRFYTFGGYGFHTFKNDINCYDFTAGQWSRCNTPSPDSIAPRYLSGLGVLGDDRLLLFGGYGSESGQQELSPHNFYDLFRIDLEPFGVHKLWTLEDVKANFVLANSMVVDQRNRRILALCYPHNQFDNSLKLYSFSIDKPQYEILADSIPYSFNDIYSYADLYISSDSTRLFAVSAYTDIDSGTAQVAIYSLLFPAMKKSELMQAIPKYYMWLYISIGLVLAVSGIGLVVLRKYRKRKSSANSQEGVYIPIVGMKPVGKPSKEQSISLFGGFQVIDKSGKDITGEFTPILKQLFVLILLYTLKDGKGISSVKLNEILWFDKSEEKARNNRGVSLSKLRVIFEQVGQVTITNENSYWKVYFGDDIYCDYYEALILMERLVKNPDPDIKDIQRLIYVTSTGEMLPYLQTDWVDNFKADFSNRLIDLLWSLSSEEKFKLPLQLQIDITNAIFVHDSLDEEALKLKCRLLVKTGKNGLARKTYESFVSKYKILFGSDFKHTFEQIIS